MPRVQGRLDEEDRDETTRLAGREVASPRRTFSDFTFSSYVMLSRDRATADTCPIFSPARASLHVINAPNNNNKRANNTLP